MSFQPVVLVCAAARGHAYLSMGCLSASWLSRLSIGKFYGDGGRRTEYLNDCRVNSSHQGFFLSASRPKC
jgi:hypothetical protein